MMSHFSFVINTNIKYQKGNNSLKIFFKKLFRKAKEGGTLSKDFVF